MKEKVCSFCDGKGSLATCQEALEVLLCCVLRLEEDKVSYIPCPRCNGTGIEIEVELQDLCRVKALPI